MVMELKNNHKHTKPTGRKLELLQLICSEKSYKEIADTLCLSLRTIEINAGHLFEELEVSNRYGLMCLAYHEHWVEY